MPFFTIYQYRPQKPDLKQWAFQQAEWYNTKVIHKTGSIPRKE
jgi:hypothetical protein